MLAMVLREHGAGTLEREVRDRPEPGPGEVLVRVLACGVCRTDLHVVDGDLPVRPLPRVPGHEIVGDVVATGPGVGSPGRGDRVGIPWLGHTCGTCLHCDAERENLCAEARFTGYDLDGGYAEYAVADARYAFPMDRDTDPARAAPLLCAGLIGYRSYRMALASVPWDVRRLGLYGFGAAAHLLTQVARHHGREVFAFTREGDDHGQRFAGELGAAWAGAGTERPPRPLDVAILFAPVGALVPEALRSVVPGGAVVCAGIHMSDVPSFPYDLLWRERTVRSVANLTRADAHEFLALAPEVPVRSHVRTYPLERAVDALDDLRAGTIEGAAVLVPDGNPAG